MYLALEMTQWLMAIAIVVLAWRHREKMPAGLCRFTGLMFVAVLFGVRCTELAVEVFDAEAMRALRNCMEWAAMSALLACIWVWTRDTTGGALDYLARKQAQVQRETETLQRWTREAREART